MANPQYQRPAPVHQPTYALSADPFAAAPHSSASYLSRSHGPLPPSGYPPPPGSLPPPGYPPPPGPQHLWGPPPPSGALPGPNGLPPAYPAPRSGSIGPGRAIAWVSASIIMVLMVSVACSVLVGTNSASPPARSSAVAPGASAPGAPAAGPRPADPAPAARTLSAFDLQPGDCYNTYKPAPKPGELQRVAVTVTVIPCTQAHTDQIVATVAYSAQDSLGEVQRTRAEADCGPKFAQVLDRSAMTDPAISASFIVPMDEFTWSRHPVVVCNVHRDTPLTRSLVKPAR